MAKTPMRCPFTEKICEECQIYRGRHYYLCANEHYRGYIQTKQKAVPAQPKKLDLDMMKKLFEPWAVSGADTSTPSKVTLKVINKENGEIRIITSEEAGKLDWENLNTMRTVNGTHVGSYEKLMEIVRYLEAKGEKEIVIIESPFFMTV